jgi:phospholipid/cholesterol/gamma-HCH transport system substrate-binding protein
MGVPGKYAPTVQECYSDKPFQPLAVRQHALGPYPFDPNLIAQGVPPDSRVTINDNIFGPTEGTPRPPAEVPAAPPPSDPSTAVPAAGPSVGVAHYDPTTGRYAAPDGSVYEQPDLVKPADSWQDLVLAGTN